MYRITINLYNQLHVHLPIILRVLRQ